MIGDELRDRTRRFALATIRLCLELGSGDLGRLIRPQLMRAGTGVAANHRAATRSRSGKEFIARLSIVIEESDESEFWLDVLETLKHGPQPTVISLRREAQELRAIFSKCRTTASETMARRRRHIP